MPLSPLLQSSRHLRSWCFGGARLQAHERVAEVVVDVVVLRREVVAFRLALLPGQLGMLLRLMHVVRNRAHVVEELGVDRPPLVRVPHRLADQSRAGRGHGVLKREMLSLES